MLEVEVVVKRQQEDTPAVMVVRVVEVMVVTIMREQT